jgi:hypothetical protein
MARPGAVVVIMMMRRVRAGSRAETWRPEYRAPGVALGASRADGAALVVESLAAMQRRDEQREREIERDERPRQ